MKKINTHLERLQATLARSTKTLELTQKVFNRLDPQAWIQEAEQIIFDVVHDYGLGMPLVSRRRLKHLYQHLQIRWPGRLEVRLLEAYTHLLNQEPTEAASIIQHLLNQNPHCCLCHAYACVLYSYTGQKDKFQTHFGAAAKCSPVSPFFQYVQYVTLREEGNYAGALKLAHQAHEQYPSFLFPFRWMGFALIELRQFEESIITFQKALKLEETYLWAWNGMGGAHSKLRRFDEAIRCFKRAIEIDSEFSFAWGNLGRVYEGLESHEEAIRCYQRALEIDPGPMWWKRLGDIHETLASYDEAIWCYQRALEIDPKYKWAWGNMGLAHQKLTSYEEAIRCYQRALEIDPEYQWAWGKLGDVHETLASYEEALRCYRRALEIDPEDEVAKNDLERVSSQNSSIPISSSAVLAPSMVYIRGGTFDMGDVMGDNEYDWEKPIPSVTVSDFLMAAHAVTFEQYDAFCAATNRDKPGDEGWGRANRPVINVDWYDGIEYCNWLSEQQGLEPVYTINKKQQDPSNQSNYDDKKWLVTANWQAKGYRLPTEAEWEYAARAVDGIGGGKVRFGNGQDIADPEQMNFDASESYKKPYSKVGICRQKTVPVDSFEPNSLGLYNMSGNVWEWCWDRFDNYTSEPKSNPTGPDSGSLRVLRGGSWRSFPRYARVAYRNGNGPDRRGVSRGFRPTRIP